MHVHTTDTDSITQRKKTHLDVCIDDKAYHIESGTTYFEQVHLIPSSTPELHISDIDSSTLFLGTRVSAPFFISCMTGGTDDGYHYNTMLAKSAQKHAIAFGIGSVRVLFHKPELTEQFCLKRFAPDVPYLINLGAAQLREYSITQINELAERLQADALVLHINPAQELCQDNGERDFSGIRSSIIDCAQSARIPIIVKETGAGLNPSFVSEMLSSGVSYADLAGSGGTNWALVELANQSQSHTRAPHDGHTSNSYNVHHDTIKAFSEWGIPTALLLAHIREHHPSLCQHILASGGIRNSLDIVKSIVMGAHLVGLALPFIRSVNKGQESIDAHILQLKEEVKKFMLLLDAQTLVKLKEKNYWTTASFSHALRAFSKALSPRDSSRTNN